MKTLAELREKPLYRFLKILYFGVLVLAASMIYWAYDDREVGYLFSILAILLILEILKRFVYYIFLGAVIPPQD